MNRSYLTSFLFIPLLLLAQTTGKNIPHHQSDGRYLLPNGWSISPAGRQIELGGLPLKLLAIPNQPFVLAMSNGYSEHFIAVINVDQEKVVQRVPIRQGWMGLAATPDGNTLFASAGAEDRILVYQFSNGRLSYSSDIPLEARTFPAGLTVNRKGDRLYVAANLSNALKVVDLKTGRVTNTIPAGEKPYTCAVSGDETVAYVSNWGQDSVAVIQLKESHLFKSIKVQEKPNDLLLTRDEARLFVANGNRNTVSVIDTQKTQVIEQIDVALLPNSPLGSTPNALALSPDEKTLYVANADNNALAVIDVSKIGKSSSLGFIPTGWYPTAVATVPSGNKLVVANGKGLVSLPNPAREPSAPVSKNPRHTYIGDLLEGNISFIDSPGERTLAEYSQQVYRNSPFARKRSQEAKAPFPPGSKGPIKYVFYIIKENRTYDQIFGDMKQGNGDPDYCLFPEKVTPNHHALAGSFVLFDNFYHDAEVSADGHHWVTSAYATDYVEKFWPSMYAQKGKKERLSLHDDPVAYSAGGFLWDLCAKAGISYRSYGEFARIHFAEPGKVRAATPSLEGHIHPTYYGADGIQQMSDRRRLEIWLEEFRQFEREGEMPQFTVLSLPGDHLLGTRPGAQTPRAMMAENDWALGKMVEALSHSRFWKQLAIFVVEDDTQGGPDHVDAHRAPALIISPYVRRNYVDNTMYSTSGLLRTMELVLGLPPLTQFDAAAAPMWAAFQATPNLRPYKALPANIDLDEKNPPNAYGAKRSTEMTLEVADTADDREYNEILWKAIKGPAAELPPRRVAAYVKERAEE